MAIYEFFTSRNNLSNVSTYVGQAGRLFYDGVTGVLKISDGITPGGSNIQLPVATTTLLGGIKAGPGANVSVDGTLTIDTAGLPLSIGNISIVDTTISTVNTNADLILESNGTGNVELRGNIHFHTTANSTSTPFFTASNDGQITILVPVTDPLSGAVKIVGSATGTVSAPLNTGVMLQLTGNNNDASRLYNDAIGSFAAFVGRRINGNIASPTAVTAGQEIIRFSATGYNGVTTPGTAGARINFAATENYTNSNFGSNIGFWACATGSNVLVKQATIDGQSGLTVTKATIQGNITAGNLTVSGTMTGVHTHHVRDAGAVSGTFTLDYATDDIVRCTFSDNITIAHANLAIGKVVTLIATNSSGADTDVITSGVAIDNVTDNDATFTVSPGHVAIIRYYSVGTTTDDLFVSPAYS